MKVVFSSSRGCGTLVVAIAVVAAGCGGGDAPATPSASAPALGLAAASPGVPIGNGAASEPSTRRRALASPRAPTAEGVMNWAESAYPQFFPGHKSTQTLAPYVYRYYPETGNYVGVDGATVAILGPLSGGALQVVGTLADFACLITPRDCDVPRIDRVAASNNVTKLVFADGRVGLLGEEDYPVKYSGLFPGSVVKMVEGVAGAVSIRSSPGFLSDKTMVLTRTGDVYAWGQGKNAMGQAYRGNDQQTVPVKVTQLSRVVDLSLADGNMTMALKDDGTVWVLPGVELDTGPVAAARVTELPRIRAIRPAGDGDYQPTMAVDESGGVWLIKRAQSVHDNVNKRTIYPVTVERMLFAPAGVQQIACSGAGSGSTCLAVVADGSLKAWGTNGGLFGNGTTTDSTLPVTVKFPAVGGIRKLSIAGKCPLVLTDAGALYYWGGGFSCYYYPDRNVPLTPQVMYSGIDDFAVYSGGRIVTVSTSGQVHSWGGAPPGESLGDGRTSSSRTPVRVMGISLD